MFKRLVSKSHSTTKKPKFSRKRVLTVFVLTLLLSAACDRSATDWESAQQLDSIVGYQTFLEKHGDSEFAEAANAQIEILREADAWSGLAESTASSPVREFLHQYPSGRFNEVARALLMRLEQEEATIAWAMALDVDNVEGYEAFLVDHPHASQLAEAESNLDVLRRTPSSTSARWAIEKAVRQGAMDTPIGSGWQIVVQIQNIQRYDVSKGFSRVNAYAAMQSSVSRFSFGFIDHYRLRLNADEDWDAEIVNN